MEPTVLCFSHLRWKFVYQRPQHLLSRCARDHRVIYFEEPMFDTGTPVLELVTTESGVAVATPHLPQTSIDDQRDHLLRELVDRILGDFSSSPPVLWYYTPMPVTFTEHLKARAIVYDCMDELSSFRGAPLAMLGRERRLMARADVVFTGGHSLYEYKRVHHDNIHPFPSSVDVVHFARARAPIGDPPDQASIPRPRIGYCGVIDERMNLELVDELAATRPDLQLVMIGPLAKIDASVLPRRRNIHWLGAKSYDELPSYMAGWDVAILPFALNDATRFISPTKTPEYLAAGKPVISTSIRDVVTPYGQAGLAWIADTAHEFAGSIDAALRADRDQRLAAADAFLAELSWDRTWAEMWAHVERAITLRERRGAHRSSIASTAHRMIARRGGG